MLLDYTTAATHVCDHPPTKRVKDFFGIDRGLSNTTVVERVTFFCFVSTIVYLFSFLMDFFSTPDVWQIRGPRLCSSTSLHRYTPFIFIEP